MVESAANFRDRVFGKYGEQCEICGSKVGLEADHVNGSRQDNRTENGMPLCGTCHNLKTESKILIDERTRKPHTNLGIFYYKAYPNVRPPSAVEVALLQFKEFSPAILEWHEGGMPILFRDEVNKAFYMECHLPARELSNAFDLNPVLRPAEESRYKYNRALQTRTKIYTRMRDDAKKGRPFSDIIVEWNLAYNSDKPLKVLGGQHRAQAIIEATESKPGVFHGVRVYFVPDANQWEEISRISNTSIPIPKPLLDKQDEQFRHGYRSRAWAQDMGLLQPAQDFADKPSQANRFTVQILRSLVVNFHYGREFGNSGKTTQDSFFDPIYLRQPGTTGPDGEYGRILEEYPDLWADRAMAEMARSYKKLHVDQKSACEGSALTAKEERDEARQKTYREYRDKVLTPQVAAAYAYTAGLLQKDPASLTGLYNFQETRDTKQSPDPLNARRLAQARDSRAKGAYRGLAMRQNKKEIRRVVELFLLLTSGKGGNSITTELIDLAIRREYNREDQYQTRKKEQELELVQQRVESAKRRESGINLP